jgi:hypothetical protein
VTPNRINLVSKITAEQLHRFSFALEAWLGVEARIAANALAAEQRPELRHLRVCEALAENTYHIESTWDIPDGYAAPL